MARMSTATRADTGSRLDRLGRPTPVLVVNGAAMTAVLLHVLIDFHIGLFGGSSEVMTPAQAGNAFRIALTAGGWLVALGVSARGSPTGTACAMSFVGVWVFLVNGLVAFLVVPPPSAAYPYQDVAHVGSIVFGGLATLALWGLLERQSGRIDRRYLLLTLAWLLLVGPLLGLFASPLMR